jgi:hypothetical protein
LQYINYCICSPHNILLLNTFPKFSWKSTWIWRLAALRILSNFIIFKINSNTQFWTKLSRVNLCILLKIKALTSINSWLSCKIQSLSNLQIVFNTVVSHHRQLVRGLDAKHTCTWPLPFFLDKLYILNK